jgi:hypothetical protein
VGLETTATALDGFGHPCSRVLLGDCTPWGREPGSSVNIVSDYGLGDRGSILDRGRGFFL